MLLDSGEEHQINERWEQGRLVACSLYSCILFAQGSDIHRVFFAISAFARLFVSKLGQDLRAVFSAQMSSISFGASNRKPFHLLNSFSCAGASRYNI